MGIKQKTITKMIVKENERKRGYVVREEIWKDEVDTVRMHDQAYTLKGDYIGGSLLAEQLTAWGIKPEKADKSHDCCSIGFCKKENKWYGWSHRAIEGFGIGDMLFDSNWLGWCDTGRIEEVPFVRRGTVRIKTMKQAKQAAINFADYASIKFFR